MDIDQHPSLFPLKTIISAGDSSYGSPELQYLALKIICNPQKQNMF